ncbi:MAG: RNA polymerase sigma factor [Verrucomicrobia bacterium]|nr:RNA polymerase sigma factor [Verrucomicrobiota bacterium]
MAKAEDALIENLNAFVAFTRKRVGDPELAADLVQDSLLKALKSAETPLDGEGAVTWFYRILRHSIIDLYRRRNVGNRALERLQSELPEQPDAAAERVLCQCVKRLLPGLPEQYRDVLQRVDLEGVAPKEAALALGTTLNNLNVRLHRARQRLREKLKATCRVCSKHGCLDCSCGDEQPAEARRRAAKE